MEVPEQNGSKRCANIPPIFRLRAPLFRFHGKNEINWPLFKSFVSD